VQDTCALAAVLLPAVLITVRAQASQRTWTPGKDTGSRIGGQKDRAIALSGYGGSALAAGP